VKPSDLLLPYLQWKSLPPPDDPAVREWLAAWEVFDLVSGETDDEKRRLIRFGHYCG